jgi:hypothetical protein
VTFYASVVYAFVGRVFQRATAKHQGFPNAMVMRRDELALGELIEFQSQLIVVIQPLGVFNVVGLAFDAQFVQVRPLRDREGCVQQTLTQLAAVVVMRVGVNGADHPSRAGSDGAQ